MKERLEKERERLLMEELERHEKEKYFKLGKQAIKKSGILDAYDLLLDDLIKNGMPKVKLNGDLFEYAAFYISKYHKKKYFYLCKYILTNRKKKEREELNKRLQERERQRGRSLIHDRDDEEISYRSESPKKGKKGKIKRS